MGHHLTKRHIENNFYVSINCNFYFFCRSELQPTPVTICPDPTTELGIRGEKQKKC